VTYASTLIVPAYNEGQRVHEGFDRLMGASREGHIDLSCTEVLYVDDGSSDDTYEQLEQIVATLPNGRALRQPHNQGKGAAIRRGVTEASGDYVLFTDADFSISLSSCEATLRALGSGAVAIGSRATNGGHIVYDDQLRTLAGRGFNWLVRGLCGVRVRDTQCGWKGFDAAWARVLFAYQSLDGFAFDVELLVLARYLKLGVVEVPVDWVDVAGSSVHVGRDSLRMLQDVATLRSRMHHLPALSGIRFEGDAGEIYEHAQGLDLGGAPVVVDHQSATVLATLDHCSGEGAERFASLAKVLEAPVVPVASTELVGADLFLARQLHD